MHVRRHESAAAHLLVSMLIRYPEVASVRYEPDSQSLIFSFFLQGNLDGGKREACTQDLIAHFAACAELDRDFSPIGKLQFTPLEDITLLTYQQSIQRICAGEICLLTSVLRNHFANEVALEPLLVDDDMKDVQDELIDRLLGHRDILVEDRPIIAYREGGKVFVYNR
ncbi:hypothetical protein [Effusibacillus pohliae]|uniref:hypothetical protein n=1 Tax=Effusibacillus pohliae TaxID=232270 RepID=UPI00035FF747|nr:hypothetical protein [Effusibacillus pohliae]